MAKLIMTVAEMADEKKWLAARREGRAESLEVALPALA